MKVIVIDEGEQERPVASIEQFPFYEVQSEFPTETIGREVPVLFPGETLIWQLSGPPLILKEG